MAKSDSERRVKPLEGVTLVIPGRNAERTIRRCLDAAVGLLGRDGLEKIVFVNDGSTDRTAEIVGTYPVTLLAHVGGGPGAARNIGWRAATTPLVWFIDSDCVVEPDALRLLLPHLESPEVVGVGGSYGNVEADSLLATIIHEEIRERHLSMDAKVDFLGGFNVVYRRDALESVGGFDEERFNGPGAPGAEDADLSYRLSARGHQMRHEPDALVGHYHPTRLSRYLRSQRLHGFWATRLYARHSGMAGSNSYSSFLDHIQPAVAMVAIGALPGLAWPQLRLVSVTPVLALGLLQLPMAGRLLRRTRDWRMLGFVPLGMVRAVARGVGMTLAVLRATIDRLGRPGAKIGFQA
jgi:cellulose synthase/poly-beta-1,6-N-acetylglucosamine synthase-like glycosyltransferase